MALGKKVKTLFLHNDVDITVAVTAWQNAVASHTFQDDIRVIGCQVGVECGVLDGAVNADQMYELKGELSRHGVGASDGAIARATWGACWTAAIVANMSTDTAEQVMFPDGHGIDFDDGEAIYLHAYTRAVGTVNLTGDVWAIVYYVER